MKTFFLVLLFSLSAFAQNLPIYPECYQGTLKTENGNIENVFLTFDRIQGTTAFVKEFKLGSYSHTYSGSIINASKVQFNNNNDYIPGGNADFNIDIELNFSENTASGIFKEYRFSEGRGGFGESNPTSIVKQGQISLNRCYVEVTIKPNP